MNENIINLFWEHIEKSNTKVSKKIYSWLNYDNLGAIVLDKDIFWFEMTGSQSTMPNYIYNYLKKWGNKLGYTYLYDVQTN